MCISFGLCAFLSVNTVLWVSTAHCRLCSFVVGEEWTLVVVGGHGAGGQGSGEVRVEKCSFRVHLTCVHMSIVKLL